VRRFIFPLCCSLVLVAVCGCKTMPTQNQPLARFSAKTGYRFANLAHDGNSDSLFVILTFSGGGTRASAFSYGVLEELARTEIEWEGGKRRLLDEVDVISSVSGGSITAAYYGLFGDRIFEDFRDRVLYRDLQGDLISKVLSPSNYRRLASPYFGKSHLLAEELDEHAYEGKTFGDLLKRNRRPFIILNATNAADGARFGFTQDDFDFLYSDLSSYPVGHAVAASAAVPAVLSALALRNYEKGPDYETPDWVTEALGHAELGSVRMDQARTARDYLDPEKHHVHLVDGGVSDNLGLLPVASALGVSYSPWSIPQMVEEGRVRKVLIISVNAENSPSKEWEKQSKKLGLFRAILFSTTIPMAHFTRAQIEYMELLLRDLAVREEERVRESSPDASDPAAAPVAYHFVEVAFNRIDDAAERRFFDGIPTTLELPERDVDRLRRVAGSLLREHPVFVEVLRDLQVPTAQK
jgi:NTE family protein